LVSTPPFARRTEERTWRELANLLNQNIWMTTPKGAVTERTMSALEAEGLVMQIRSTSDKKAFPKGRHLAPKSDAKMLDLLTKGRKFRMFGTMIGAWAGECAVLGWIGDGPTTAGCAISLTR